jgi:hypothetical protein
MSLLDLRLFRNRVTTFLFTTAALFTFVATTPSIAQAQRSKAQGDGPESSPVFSEFKGVRLGMSADEARKKLGSPHDKADDVDIYVFNDNQGAQVYYDKAKTVMAISIDFSNGASDIPLPKAVVGGEPDARADGSAFKMVRYPKAGYWVSYSKTAGASPTITITMQKIDQ